MGVTAAIIGAAVLGAASTGYQVMQQKKAAKKQSTALARQQQEAKDAARERALLENARTDDDADVSLGRQDSTVRGSANASAGLGGASSRSGSVTAKVGGLGALPKASRRIGL